MKYLYIFIQIFIITDILFYLYAIMKNKNDMFLFYLITIENIVILLMLLTDFSQSYIMFLKENYELYGKQLFSALIMTIIHGIWVKKALSKE